MIRLDDDGSSVDSKDNLRQGVVKKESANETIDATADD